MRLLILIAAIAATTANAAPVPSSATLAASARSASIVTAGGLWHCDGAACTGLADARLGEAVAACTDLAAGAGRVATFTAAGYAFTAADLARCNRHVRG